MADTDINKTTTTSMSTAVSNYTVSSKIVDEPSKTTETVWDNPNWPKYLGYFKAIPEFKEAIRALARWSFGRGFTANQVTMDILDHVRGSGEDSFQSVITNHCITKKVNGDAYIEIIRDPESKKIINLKPLNPTSMRTIFNKKGIITRYEEYDPDSKEAKRKFQPEEIFHSMNDRIANETHGTSVLEACQWVIDARNEAMADWRRISHRSTIRVMYIDADDTTKLSNVRTQYHEAINKGEVLIMPGKKGENITLEDIPIPGIDSFIRWILLPSGGSTKSNSKYGRLH
jgi:hypothetical protein